MHRLLVAFLAALPAMACFCFSNASPCSELGSTAVVFVADVVVDSGEGMGTGPAKVTIVEPLQNVPKGLKEATIGTSAGTSCYFRLRAGERYVIITDGPRFSVQACNPSFRLAGNEHILDAMRSHLKGEPLRLVGSVQKRTGRYSHEGTIANVSVELTIDESHHTTRTDAAGHYVITGLKPGSYKLKISKPGYLPDDEYNQRWSGRMRANPDTHTIEPVKDIPGEISVSGPSCEIRDLAMWPAGSIQGTIRNVDGTPASGVPVQAFAFDAKGERESSPLRVALTSVDGSYSIQPLPSGRYVIGINASLYRDENPHPPTLYDSGRSISLEESASVAAIDFTVRPPRTAAKLRLRAVDPDGKPYKQATVKVDTPEGEERAFFAQSTDENGELLIPVYLGERYRVKVLDYLDNATAHYEGSALVNITDRESTVTVVLQLKP